MALFDLFKKKLIAYNANHNWLRLINDCSIDMDSVVLNTEGKYLDVLISSQADMGLDLSLWRINFAHDKQCQAFIREEVILSLVDGKYYGRNSEPQYGEIEQDSAIGMIYNKYQSKFGAHLPYDFSDQWLVIKTDNNVFLLDASSIQWRGSVIRCAMRALREEEGLDDQILFAYDTEADLMGEVEEGVFFEGNRTFTHYQDDFVKAADIFKPLCEILKENSTLLHDPDWCQAQAQTWKEIFNN